MTLRIYLTTQGKSYKQSAAVTYGSIKIGATTLRITTISKTTKKCDTQNNGSIVMLSVANNPFMLSTVMSNPIMLSVVMLNAIMLNATMLSGVVLQSNLLMRAFSHAA